ncbi:MAG: hypothetical protein LUQ07_00050 [Methanospirillum sp.]|nr:hypothetical protein [Methanospirillum sp.]
MSIRSADYTPIDRGFDSGPCACCGTKWVNYQERMTHARLAGPPRSNLKICSKCYEAAKRAEAASFRMLPGMVNPALMTRISADLGKCRLCNTQRAVWKDPGSGIAICETCYQHLSQDEGARGGVSGDGGF